MHIWDAAHARAANARGCRARSSCNSPSVGLQPRSNAWPTPRPNPDAGPSAFDRRYPSMKPPPHRHPAHSRTTTSAPPPLLTPSDDPSSGRSRERGTRGSRRVSVEESRRLTKTGSGCWRAELVAADSWFIVIWDIAGISVPIGIAYGSGVGAIPKLGPAAAVALQAVPLVTPARCCGFCALWPGSGPVLRKLVPMNTRGFHARGHRVAGVLHIRCVIPARISIVLGFVFLRKRTGWALHVRIRGARREDGSITDHRERRRAADRREHRRAAQFLLSRRRARRRHWPQVSA